MQLVVDDGLRELTPLASFRAAHGLPEAFGVEHFEPGESVPGAGLSDVPGQLETLRRNVLGAVAPSLTSRDLLSHVEALAFLFGNELRTIDIQGGLNLSDVILELAEAGFLDVLRTAAYRLIQLALDCRNDPECIGDQFDGAQMYADWLNSTVRVSAAGQVYESLGARFEVRTIHNAYGPVGLRVEAGGEVHYVADTARACPVRDFMELLCADVTRALAGSFMRGAAP